MDDSRTPPSPPPPPAGGPAPPVAEADLHAFADGLLDPARHAAVDAFLDAHPDARERVEDWRAQNRALRALLDPVLAEPLPLRLPLAPGAVPAGRWRMPGRALAAGVAVALASGGAAWWGRGAYDRLAQARPPAAAALAQAGAGAGGLAHRAAVAHAVYSPDARRPVEVGADQEQALVAWLTRRLGAAVRAPDLRPLGWRLVGGRLLPGSRGPVAQFMFERAPDAQGADGASAAREPQGVPPERLTLYLAREDAGRETAFRFAQDGPVNVFHWVDPDFGYALSSAVGRRELLRAAEAVHRQLERRG
ncbi:MAG: anti-sigma factor [Xylophilus ampelinus]